MTENEIECTDNIQYYNFILPSVILIYKDKHILFRGAVYFGETAHYSFAKALGVTGILKHLKVRMVNHDKQGMLDLDDLRKQIINDKKVMGSSNTCIVNHCELHVCTSSSVIFLCAGWFRAFHGNVHFGNHRSRSHRSCWGDFQTCQTIWSLVSCWWCIWGLLSHVQGHQKFCWK